MTEPTYLEVDEIAALQDELIERFGGIRGLKSETLLDSAANRPRFKAYYQGADLETQAAALMFGLAKNHAFQDGNKRISAAATSVFLRLNGHFIDTPNDDLASFLEGCSSEDWTEELVNSWLQERVAPLRAEASSRMPLDVLRTS